MSLLRDTVVVTPDGETKAMQARVGLNTGPGEWCGAGQGQVRTQFVDMGVCPGVHMEMVR